ncbi:alpha/beta hydrolase [Arthrobacter livingstonensis]|uniref:Alpha/beta hydrolase n=1 Tax=Arthrobacter livingstonensis TaxID=670078 RepID=A0A2V5LUP0_9MICC|nr:alpha/beta fold hydrolase [Arthrobacter livingstonensis]PYI65676.1 alpha/beta hydrolase [Arthrobacter livingstonensis]
MVSSTHNPADGVELSYDAVGDGEPILLLHGSALSRAIWRGFGYTKALRENHRVISMDLRGHGRSGKPHVQDAYAMDVLVADALAVLDASGAPQAHFGGYSVGSRIGYALAVAAPERLLSLTTLAGTFRIQPGSVGKLFFDGYDAALGEDGMPGFVEGWERRIGAPLDSQTKTAFLANDAAALRAYFRQTEAEPAIDEADVAAITLPALLLAGTADRERLEDSRRAAELMPNARVVELPGRNHGTTLVPAQPILDEWLPFLQGL